MYTWTIVVQIQGTVVEELNYNTSRRASPLILTVRRIGSPTVYIGDAQVLLYCSYHSVLVTHNSYLGFKGGHPNYCP